MSNRKIQSGRIVKEARCALLSTCKIAHEVIKLKIAGEGPVKINGALQRDSPTEAARPPKKVEPKKRIKKRLCPIRSMRETPNIQRKTRSNPSRKIVSNNGIAAAVNG